MRQGSDSPAAPPASPSSTASVGLRKVRLSDRGLFRRVQRVAVPDGPVDLHGLSPKRGWKRVRAGVARRMTMQFRVLRPSTTVRQCQVVVGGGLRARPAELLSLLRTPTENESNALLRALYGSQFIYSSLLHAVPNTERRSLSSPPPSYPASVGPQLTVRTVSFAHTKRLNPFDSRISGEKNEQSCYVELLTPTPRGFKLAFCTLDAAEVTAGKAPPERVTPLHPITAWLIAESSSTNPETLEITFQAAFPGHAPGGCDSRVAQGRLLSIAKGISRLEKVLRRRRRYQQGTAPGRVWQTLLNPLRAFRSDGESSGGTHHNWHCIACTRSFLPTLHKSWRRCDLCSYRVCAEPPCCTRERVAIYNRYVAPLLVCARCRECFDECEGDNRGSGNPADSGLGDVRYTGVSLRFTGQGSELEPEFEVDPTHSRWGAIISPRSSRRSSGGMRTKRRAQSDPPPMLGLAFFSSDNSSSGAELAPRSANEALVTA